jgi:hypothetical protein
MRQRRWLELIKDYNCYILYHAGKVNVVANALSRKSCSEVLNSLSAPDQLAQEIGMIQLDVHDPLHVVDFEPLQVQEDLRYEKLLVQILDRKEQQLRTKTIPLVKVLWRNHDVEEVSWEIEKNKEQIPTFV